MMNFPFGTNGKFIIFRCPNTLYLSTLGYFMFTGALICDLFHENIQTDLSIANKDMRFMPRAENS